MERVTEASLQAQYCLSSMMKEMPKNRCHFKPEGLPLETWDPAFCTPVDFEKILNTLWYDLKKLDTHAVVANRYSEKYLSLSRELEALIRKMGSFCLTKAVLEQQGHSISGPKELTIPELESVVGYHFNKAHAAVDGTELRNIRFYLAMLSQETRWGSLLCRLKATEDKIRLIRDGKLEVRVLPESDTDTPKQNKNRSQEKCDEKTFVKAALPASLPLQKDLVRAEAGADVQIAAPAKAEKAVSEEAKQTAPETVEKKDEVSAETNQILPEKAEAQAFPEETETSGAEPETAEPGAAALQESDKDLTTAEKTKAEIIPAGKEPAVPEPERHPEESGKMKEELLPEPAESETAGHREDSVDIHEEHQTELSAEHGTPLITEEEYTRDLLMDAAVRAGDRQAYEKAMQAEGPELDRLWRNFLMEDARKGFPYMRELELRMGHQPPPEEVPHELDYAPIEILYA